MASGGFTLLVAIQRTPATSPTYCSLGCSEPRQGSPPLRTFRSQISRGEPGTGEGQRPLILPRFSVGRYSPGRFNSNRSCTTQ
ncbi:hypothetical protein SAMN04488030_1858 [Aliiroseovarius halocynthiae]|nr:hypothetical protein SAMN04488030_1858 [Aliiroseovarius halocynthiae]